MDTMLYDGDCGFCRAARRCLSALDVTGRVRWQAYQALAAPPDGLAWHDLDRAAYLRTADGRLFEGYHAFRALTVRLPMLMPLAPLAWLPGMGALGSRAYRWVAANRRRIGLGCRIRERRAHNRHSRKSLPPRMGEG